MKNTVKFEFLSLSENEALARSVAAAFIMPLDPTLEELADVRTAVSEAVTNAIVHGYKKKKGTVRMECRLDGRLLVISITDFGCGIENIEQARQPFFTTDADGERSGMGFAVMEAFMDDVDVVSRRDIGTRITLKNSSRNRIIRQFATALRTAKATCTMKKAKMIRNAFPAGIQSNRHTE